MTMAKNVQDAYDLTIQAFRISEDKRVLLPVMIGFDGFILTHTIKRLEVLDDETVDMCCLLWFRCRNGEEGESCNKKGDF